MIYASMQKFSDQIRRAIDQSGMTRYAICKAIGLSESSMSQFMAGTRGLSFDTLDKLAALLKLHVVSGQPRKGR